MVKIVHEYEASDIDIKNDPVHGYLAGAVMMIMLALAFDTKPVPGDEAEAWVNRQIASILNMAQKQGISITKSELPAEFKTTT